MDTCLVNRNSPIRSGIAPTLRHRSRPSESDTGNIVYPSPADVLSYEPKSGKEKESQMTQNSCNMDTSQNESSASDPSIKTESKSMFSYFMSELTGGYKLEADAFVQRRDRVYTSVNTPMNLEKFCAFGFLQCMDSILFMVTFLPLRILGAILRVVIYPFTVIFARRQSVLDAGQICDLLKGIILVVSCSLTSSMDMSMIYHIVRGQSIIKFYVFYNMLDVMDKLISGFGQDVLDSLYWTAVEPRGRKREHFGTVFHLIFAIVYVVIHTIMILVQAIILNVAFNSHNKTLLTVMMSNNFVEIKGNLFKRLDKNNLCQITYSDVKERFHYLVLLLFVFIRNMTELQWSWEMAFPILQDSFIVLLVEMVVDWIKHAFITKFNELSASSYRDFALGLAQDIASSQKKHAFTNFSDQVCRRMGFTPMPLICLLFMVCSKSFDLTGAFAWLLVGMFYLCLVSTKVLNSIILLGWAQRLINEKDKNAKATGTVVNSQVIPKKEDKSSAPPVPNPPSPVVPVVYTVVPTISSSNIAVNTDTSLYSDSMSQMSSPVSDSDQMVVSSELVYTQSDDLLSTPLKIPVSQANFVMGVKSSSKPSSPDKALKNMPISSLSESFVKPEPMDFEVNLTFPDHDGSLNERLKPDLNYVQSNIDNGITGPSKDLFTFSGCENVVREELAISDNNKEEVNSMEYERVCDCDYKPTPEKDVNTDVLLTSEIKDPGTSLNITKPYSSDMCEERKSSPPLPFKKKFSLDEQPILSGVVEDPLLTTDPLETFSNTHKDNLSEVSATFYFDEKQNVSKSSESSDKEQTGLRDEL